MSVNPVTAMDVDSPTSTSGSLKRSSSAPMINDINTTMTTSPSTNSAARDSSGFNLFSTVQARPRRFSASFSPIPGPRLTPRISQLRQEECVEREVAHERDVHCQMQMSQSCEDLALAGDTPGSKSPELRAKDLKMAPLHLTLTSYQPLQPLCSSPSPTFASVLWKTQSPSPSRKQTYLTRRSLSPIAMRQSSLGPVKRKLDDDKDLYMSPRAKRFNSYTPQDRGLLMAQPTTSSPLPGSLSSVGTPESVSSADSPGFAFRALDSPSPSRPPPQTADEPMLEERPLATVDQSSS